MEPTQTPRAIRVQRRRVEAAYGEVRQWIGSDPDATAALDGLRHEMDRVWALQQQAVAGRDSLSTALLDSLTPRPLYSTGALSFGYCYEPGDLYAGGDFYDVFPTGQGGWRLCLGDVRGKGAPAAATALMVRHALRTAAHLGHPPESALRAAHDLVLADSREEPEPEFCTAAVAQVRVTAEDAGLRLALAGHPAALLLRADGAVERAGAPGTALGLLDTLETSEARVALAPGDVCVLYSDGVTEARDGAEEFGDDRLVDVLASSRGMGAQAVVDCVRAAIDDFRTGAGHDDVTLLAVSWRPSAH